MINVVYDVDDVLNNLNNYVCDKLNIDSSKLDNFDIRKCSRLTAQEQENILDMYGRPDTFKNLTYVRGAEDICEIEKTGKALVWINSKCFNQEIADIKAQTLTEAIKGLNPDRLIFQIGTDQKKSGLDFADIIVEDNLLNLRKYSTKTIKYLVNKFHNQSETYNTTDIKEKLIRVPNLIEANRQIRKYVEGD